MMKVFFSALKEEYNTQDLTLKVFFQSYEGESGGRILGGPIDTFALSFRRKYEV